MDSLLTVVLASMGTAIFAVVIGTLGLAYWDFRKNIRAMTAALDKFNSMDQKMESVPVLLAGLTKACETIAGATVGFSGSVTKFHRDLFNSGKGSFQAYDENKANEAYAIDELTRMGYSPESAKAKMGVENEEERFHLG